MTTYTYALGEPVLKIQRYLSIVEQKTVHIWELDWKLAIKGVRIGAFRAALQFGSDGIADTILNSSIEKCQTTVSESYNIFCNIATHKLKQKLLEHPKHYVMYVMAASRSDVVELFLENPHHQVQLNGPMAASASYRKRLSENPHAIPVLKKYPYLINWEYFSYNPSPDAIELLKQHPDKINLENLVTNHGDKAVQYVIDHYSQQLVEKRNLWYQAGKNSNPMMINWLKENVPNYQPSFVTTTPANINTEVFSNTNPQVIQEIKLVIDRQFANINQVYWFLNQYAVWENFSKNPAVFDILDTCAHLLMKYHVYENSAAFEYDYTAMRENMRPFAEEIIAKAMHPRRIAQWMEVDEEEEEESDEK